MTDTYNTDVSQLQALFTKLESQVEEIEQIKKEKSGSSTNRQMYLATATFNTLSTNMKQLERLSSIYETDSAKFANVSKKEKEKRR